MNIDRDVIRVAAPPILAACVVALLVGPTPDDDHHEPRPHQTIGAKP